MNTRGFPGMFAPTYQEFARGKSVRFAISSTCSPPLLLGICGGLDPVEAAFAHVREAGREPVDVLLDRDDHVAQHGRTAGPGDGEQVREAGNHQPEVRAGSVGPPVAQRDALATTDVDAQQGAGHRIEAGGEDDRVELVIVVGCADAGAGELDDGRLLQVDERDVRSVVRLEVVDVDAKALGRRTDGRSE